MSKEDLEQMYPDGFVCTNQDELGRKIHEVAIRAGNKAIADRFPLKKMSSNPDGFYDIAEMALSSGVAFCNDGCYIVEDVSDLQGLK